MQGNNLSAGGEFHDWRDRHPVSGPEADVQMESLSELPFIEPYGIFRSDCAVFLHQIVVKRLSIEVDDLFEEIDQSLAMKKQCLFLPAQYIPDGRHGNNDDFLGDRRRDGGVCSDGLFYIFVHG